MFKFKRMICGLGAFGLAVSVWVGVAYGAPVRIADFVGCGITKDFDGMGLLNSTPTGTTIVQLILNSPLFGGQEIRISLERENGDSTSFTATTDLNGVLTIHESIGGDWSDGNVFISQDGFDLVLAFGQNPNNVFTCGQNDLGFLCDCQD